MNTEAWDVFMTVSRDSGIVAAQCFEGPVRIVKCAVYLLFFAIVIICTFASKVSLLMMTTGAGNHMKVIDHHCKFQVLAIKLQWKIHCC